MNYFEEDTLDDLLRVVLSKLLTDDNLITASRSGELGGFTEIFGAMLVLKNPRARLSRSESKGKVFSALGELFWYLSKTNQLTFIKYYLSTYDKESDDGVLVRSGYGERLFWHNGADQMANVISILKNRPTSRRAVIQLFDASDLLEDYKSIPCTCTLQFLVRDGRLNMLVNMRSNDAFLGLPHDIFTFTMIQEIVARSIGVEVGLYKHSVGSLHLYEKHHESAKAYLGEAWQQIIPMGAMPEGCPWQEIETVKGVEELIRVGAPDELPEVNLSPYWRDICNLLLAFKRVKNNDYEGCNKIRDQLIDKSYRMFIDDRLQGLF